MARKQQLEQVFNLLLAEQQDKAAEILHQLIVEKARTIYESIIAEDELEDDDEVGGSATDSFTDSIESDIDDIETEEENDGEVEDDEGSTEDDEDSNEVDDESEDEEVEEIEDRVEDLESQLEALRAEFDALMDEELEEPNHADLADEMDHDTEQGGDYSDLEGDMDSVDFEQNKSSMFEKKKSEKLKKAPQAKDTKIRGDRKKMDEETKFLNKVADTGQRGTAKLAGTGNKSTHGAEQNQSPYTRAPKKTDFGGKPVKIGSGTGGEPGKYHGEKPSSENVGDNFDAEPKKVSMKADSTAKYTGGKAAGNGGNKSPLSSKP